MLESMTGFGRAVADVSAGKLVVEIQSVNRKYLEVFVSIPKEYARFENDVRKWVVDQVGRGQVSVRIHLIPEVRGIEGLLPDSKFMQDFKLGWERLAQQLGYETSAITFPFLVEKMPFSSSIQFGNEKDLKVLESCVYEALESLTIMKKKEGGALAKDFIEKLDRLQKGLADIRLFTSDATSRMREKLKERMQEVFQHPAELQERLLREVAIFAEKVDISEEMTRLDSHFAQFRDSLQKQVSSSGRKMDFMIQEMGREINTIGAKSADVNISRLVVEMKSDLEKMREQVQNIE